MFYKNKVHYESTLKKVIREDYDMDVYFDSELAKKFVDICFKTSDREEELTLGYDFMCFIKHKCSSVDDVRNAIKTAISSLESLLDDGGGSIKEFSDIVLSELDYTITKDTF